MACLLAFGTPANPNRPLIMVPCVSDSTQSDTGASILLLRLGITFSDLEVGPRLKEKRESVLGSYSASLYLLVSITLRATLES